MIVYRCPDCNECARQTAFGNFLCKKCNKVWSRNEAERELDRCTKCYKFIPQPSCPACKNKKISLPKKMNKKLTEKVLGGFAELGTGLFFAKAANNLKVGQTRKVCVLFEGKRRCWNFTRLEDED